MLINNQWTFWDEFAICVMMQVYFIFLLSQSKVCLKQYLEIVRLSVGPAGNSAVYCSLSRPLILPPLVLLELVSCGLSCLQLRHPPALLVSVKVRSSRTQERTPEYIFSEA